MHELESVDIVVNAISRDLNSLHFFFFWLCVI